MKKHASIANRSAHSTDRRSPRGSRSRAERFAVLHMASSAHPVREDVINLEWFHKNSWRQYLASAMVVTALGLSVFGSDARAATKAEPAAVETKLSFDAGDEILPKAKNAKKTAVKTPVRTAAIKHAVRPDEKKPKEKVTEKTVKGNVVFIRKNKMAVETGEADDSSQEMLLSLDKNVKVLRVKNFAEIKQGDQVQVKYDETYLDPKEKGGEPTVLKMVGKEITFIKKAPPVVESTAIVSGEMKGAESE